MTGTSHNQKQTAKNGGKKRSMWFSYDWASDVIGVVLLQSDRQEGQLFDEDVECCADGLAAVHTTRQEERMREE